MKFRSLKIAFLFLAATLLATSTVLAASGVPARMVELIAQDIENKPLGKCPLETTVVQAEISGFLARVQVTHVFKNTFTEKIQAIYVFPLSERGAVDSMVMKVGGRTIRGQIKERNEARQVYEQARQAGDLAALLDQERANAFTQSVANIEPGERIEVTITYSEQLKWEEGNYAFVVPTVVGPRYFPNDSSVAGAERMSPPVTPEGTRTGHDISITVDLQAGRPLASVVSKLHEISVEYRNAEKTAARIKLKPLKAIPNKDFVLSFSTAGGEITDTVLTHASERGKYFTLVLQPPARIKPEHVVPKEIIFVVDSSGSMGGFPIETAKATMRRCIEGMHPDDTFNLMTFSGHQSYCFEGPVANTDENRGKALGFLHHLQGIGGTEMMGAIRSALAGKGDKDRLRVVCFMTDGYVGNDMDIINAIKDHAGTARVFSMGIGSSVNRYLLDGMAQAGRGEVEYVLDARQSEEVSARFSERVHTPVLTDIKLDFGKLEVKQVLPASIPDMFAVRPIVVVGRYEKGGKGTLTLRGRNGFGEFRREIVLELPDENKEGQALASLWAREKVNDLMIPDLFNIQRGTPTPEVRSQIVSLGLEFGLLTQFTSFVAVEQRPESPGGPGRTIEVPVELPQGMKYESNDEIQSLSVGGAGSGAGAGGFGMGRSARPTRPTKLGVYGGTKASESGAAAASIAPAAAANSSAPAGGGAGAAGGGSGPSHAGALGGGAKNGFSETGGIAGMSIKSAIPAFGHGSQTGQGAGRRRSNAAIGGVVGASEIKTAVDGLTTTTSREAGSGDLLVVWLIDATPSAIEQRSAMADSIDAWQKKTPNGGDHKLSHAVVAFADTTVEIRNPTENSMNVGDAIRKLPVATTGDENVMAAVNQVLEVYGKKWKGSIVINVWLNEAGDDLNKLEEVIYTCRKRGVMVNVVGPMAVLGSSRGRQYYVDKSTKFGFQLPVNLGPDTHRPERVNLPYWWDGPMAPWTSDGALAAVPQAWNGGPYRENVMSGVGAFALTRLAMETGGQFILLNERKDQVTFPAEVMKRYLPDYKSPAEYQASVDASPLRQKISAAVQITLTLNDTPPPTFDFMLVRDKRYPFQGQRPFFTPQQFRGLFAVELPQQQANVKFMSEVIEQALAQFPERGMDAEYGGERSARWRAWYDLNYGRLLAMSVRAVEYLNACEQLSSQGYLKADTNRVLLRPAEEFQSGEKSAARAQEATRLLTRCKTENAGTPWELLADWELRHPLGIAIQQLAIPPGKPAPPTAPAAPTPKILFPKL